MESALKWGFFVLYIGIAFVSDKYSNDKKASKAIDTIVIIIGIAILVFYIVLAISYGIDFWDILAILFIIGIGIYLYHKGKSDKD